MTYAPKTLEGEEVSGFSRPAIVRISQATDITFLQTRPKARHYELLTHLKTIFAGALLSGAAITAMAFSLATAQADPVPPGASGPYKCCPGDENGGLHPQTGRGCPSGVNWDKSQCHTRVRRRVGAWNASRAVYGREMVHRRRKR